MLILSAKNSLQWRKIHSKTTNVILPGLVTKRERPHKQNCIQIQVHRCWLKVKTTCVTDGVLIWLFLI